MKTLFKLIVILGFITLTSCENKLESVMKGMWSIDTLYFKNNDVKSCFYSNVINIKDDGEIVLPELGNGCEDVIKKTNTKFGNWQIIESTVPNDTMPYKIKITSVNEVFNGNHRMIFHRDEVNKLLKLEIWSDSLYIICRKGLFDYDYNKKLVNELEKASWTTRTN